MSYIHLLYLTIISFLHLNQVAILSLYVPFTSFRDVSHPHVAIVYVVYVDNVHITHTVSGERDYHKYSSWMSLISCGVQ